MATYCTGAELTELQPDLENATLHLTPDDAMVPELSASR
jgi:hypothetical protein